ncbi:Major Facilitator Superfamily protein [Verrucomicrobium sp. GAS474]|uniref:MFS transporter n=1 Tax=Verrucomicrobium sp. GAS474 TaxID=1882831 RepID=UPI00087C44CE|nr:MFS transporter [Verrucomicrobium sp. GAS474]SDU22057.1 Major Facilitator Superfamily protein [Verrucomicrobium sp. GAS474]
MTALTDADRNWRRFVFFRVLFNSRFYYPVLAVLFLDLGLSGTEYTLLNFAWALAIVFTDLPAGVLADRIGRKPLIVTAAVLMVAEMVLLSVAPRNGGWILVLCCLANRLLSGIAEGMASGADEALVFDSLAERNRSDEWPQVLNQVMRWQSVGMMIAMLVGGAVYDPAFLSGLLAAVGIHVHLDQATTLRFPVYLNLATALLALWTVLGLREPSVHVRRVAPEAGDRGNAEATAWNIAARAGGWIAKTPVALFVIVAGVILDSVVRLFLTFSSSYYRLIHLPEALFGIVGASLGGLGLVVSPLARRLVGSGSVARNYLHVTAVVVAGLIGVAYRWNHWGVLFLFPLGAAMMTLGYMVSYYLNALVDSSHRATVLSFKGVAFNLGYGFISLAFAVVLRSVRNGGDAQAAVGEALVFLPAWVAFGGGLCAVLFWRKRRELGRVV